VAKPRRDTKRLPYAGQHRLAPPRHTIAKQSAAVLALGLGLAAGVPAEATVVYTAIPTADQTITNGNLDFLETSVSFFQFSAYHFNNSSYAFASVNAKNYGGYMVHNPGSYYAALLKFGTPINASSYFDWNGRLAYTYYGYPSGGDWLGKKGYLGLQFQDADAATHYGWAKLEVPGDLSSLILYGFAYETDIDTPILAGAGDPSPVPLPSSLALLASGAAGLLAYRRMKRAA
jgi:hypothetical protein